MSVSPPVRASGPLLLADISGYTSFLQSVAVAHADDTDARIPEAYGLMSSLLDGIVERVVPPFTLSKLEGDAVFAFATEGDSIPTGEALLACTEACYAEFRRRVDGAAEIWSCGCGVCARRDLLDLKFILHAGSFVVQSIAGNRELVGPDVVMAHRLLKSGAATVTDGRAYVLMTAAATERYAVPTVDAVALRESYDHYEPIDCWVYRLGRDAAT